MPHSDEELRDQVLEKFGYKGEIIDIKKQVPNLRFDDAVSDASSEDGSRESTPAPEASASGDIALWEETANAVIFSIPLGFLLVGLDIIVNKQYNEAVKTSTEVGRLVDFMPGLLLLTFIVNRPASRRVVSYPLEQTALLLASIVCGVFLVDITTNASFLKVIQRAPPIGVIWVFCVVWLDLKLCLVGLGVVLAVVQYRGQMSSLPL